jgi:hypothetical protein
MAKLNSAKSSNFGSEKMTNLKDSDNLIWVTLSNEIN